MFFAPAKGVRKLLHFLAGEVKLRCGQKHEHEDCEPVAIGQAAHDLSAKLEKAGAEDVIAELLVLQQSHDDAEQPEDPAAGNQAAGVARAGTGAPSSSAAGAAFHEPADNAAGEDSHCGGNGKIGAGG